MLDKLPEPGRPINLDLSWARAFCACRRCGWGLFGHFLSSIISFLSPSLCETARFRLKYCLKGPLNPKQQTNQHLKESALLKRVPGKEYRGQSFLQRVSKAAEL